MSVAVLIERVLSILSQVLGISLSILGFASKSAQEHSPYAIETIAANGTNVLVNPTYGNAALKSILDDIRSAINVPAATVRLPVVPPAGYGGSAVADIWAYPLLDLTPSGPTADQALSWAAQYARQAGSAGSAAIFGSRWFRFEKSLSESITLPGYITPPAPDFLDIHSAETVVAWLNRTEANYTPWLYDATTDTCYSKWPSSIDWQNNIRCTLHEADLMAIRNGYANPSTPTFSPPAWPGLANVTLGAPSALAADTTIAGPMDGLLVTITTPPTGLGKFVIGGKTWWYRAGHLAFVDDRGDVEAWQYLTWDHGLYAPLSMVRASSCLVRLLAGALGTGTPWTVV